MKINFKNYTIEMTKSEAKAASKYGSDSYKELMNIKKDFPTFEVVVIAKPKAKKNSAALKGLNYEFMKKYIAENEKDDTVIKEFKILRGEIEDVDGIKATAKSYAYIKSWFLSKYPFFVDYKRELENIDKNIKATNSKASNEKIEVAAWFKGENFIWKA